MSIPITRVTIRIPTSLARALRRRGSNLARVIRRILAQAAGDEVLGAVNPPHRPRAARRAHRPPKPAATLT